MSIQFTTLVKPRLASNYPQQSAFAAALQDDLLYQIKLRTHQMGWGFYETNSLCEWIVDSQASEDSWQDIRPW